MWTFINEAVTETLVIALAVIVLDKLYRFTQPGFTKQNHAVQARFFNRTDKPFGISVHSVSEAAAGFHSVR
jgi:hypothetical protein